MSSSFCESTLNSFLVNYLQLEFMFEIRVNKYLKKIWQDKQNL